MEVIRPGYSFRSEELRWQSIGRWEYRGHPGGPEETGLPTPVWSAARGTGHMEEGQGSVVTSKQRGGRRGRRPGVLSCVPLGEGPALLQQGKLPDSWRVSTGASTLLDPQRCSPPQTP